MVKFNLKLRKPKKLLGVDIQDKSCLVVVYDASCQVVLASFECEKETLLTHCANLKLTNAEAVFAIPMKHVFTEVVSVPANLNQNMLEQQLLYLAHDLCPYPLAQLAYDYQYIDEEKDKAQYLFVAAKKELIAEREYYLSESGLVPVVADVAHFALMQSVKHCQNTESYMLYHFDTELLTLVVVKNQWPQYRRHVSIIQNSSTEQKQVALERLRTFFVTTNTNMKHLPVFVSGAGDLKRLGYPVIENEDCQSDYALAMGLALRGAAK